MTYPKHYNIKYATYHKDVSSSNRKDIQHLIFYLTKRLRHGNIYMTKFYDECNWLLKIDTDSYVDIDRYSDFLKHHFNQSNNYYMGYIGDRRYIDRDRRQPIYLAWGGGYLISKGLLQYIKWNFYEMRSPNPVHMSQEDTQFAVIMKRHSNTTVTPLNRNYMMDSNRNKMATKWKRTANTTKKCIFVWHKVTPSFRLQIIEDMKRIPYDTDHCKHKETLLTRLSKSLKMQR
eukprot:343742_1